MPRYIEEDAIRQGKFHLNYLIPDGDKDDSYWYQLGWNGAIDTVLDCLPKVEAEPVRHGHWGEEWFDHKHKIVCSVCECFADKWTDYCPNCGAKMDEVRDE